MRRGGGPGTPTALGTASDRRMNGRQLQDNSRMACVGWRLKQPKLMKIIPPPFVVSRFSTYAPSPLQTLRVIACVALDDSAFRFARSRVGRVARVVSRRAALDRSTATAVCAHRSTILPDRNALPWLLEAHAHATASREEAARHRKHHDQLHGVRVARVRDDIRHREGLAARASHLVHHRTNHR